jgi:2-oxoglutarate ferredoxin oxidoreductase subunit alpha
MEAEEVRVESYNCDGDEYELLLVAFGTTARVVRTAVDDLKKEGIEVGFVRPITVYPFPFDEVRRRAETSRCEQVLVVEMSMGQMIDDVRYAVDREMPIHFLGRGGGNVPSPEEVVAKAKELLAGSGGAS